MNEDPSTWRLQTEGGIPYKLIHDGPRGVFDDVTGEIKEQILIQEADMQDFLEESFSKYTVTGDTWEWRKGREYPKHSFMTSRVEFEPYPKSLPGDPFQCDEGSPDGTYASLCLVTITYSSAVNKDWISDIIELNGNVSGEFLLVRTAAPLMWYRAWATLPGGTILGTVLEAAKDTSSINKVIPGVEYTVKFRPIPWAAMNRIMARCRGLLGCVNKDNNLPLFNAVDRETILFIGMSFRTQFGWKDYQPFTLLELKFLEKRFVDNTIENYSSLPVDGVFGWNHFYNARLGYFQRLVRRRMQITMLGNVEPIMLGSWEPMYARELLAPLFNLRT